jgi:hypothetical protein
MFLTLDINWQKKYNISINDMIEAPKARPNQPPILAIQETLI